MSIDEAERFAGEGIVGIFGFFNSYPVILFIFCVWILLLISPQVFVVLVVGVDLVEEAEEFIETLFVGNAGGAFFT
jgi:hypothetical protein